MDIRQSLNYAGFMRSLGWKVEKAGQANVFIRHLPIISRLSVIKVQRPESINFGELDRIAKKHHALFVKLEPNVATNYELLTTDYRKDNWPLLPTKTLVINTSMKFESLPKDTRYEVRAAEKNGVVVQTSEDIEIFYKLLQETMKIGRWSVPILKEVTNLYQSFQPDSSQLLIAYQNSTPVAGCLLIHDKTTAHYMYAASALLGRKLSAAYLVLWEAIKWCQQERLRFLDLEGIYDERFKSHTKDWQGFTKFKEGWSGKVIEYPGSFTKFCNPLAKLLFSVAH